MLPIIPVYSLGESVNPTLFPLGSALLDGVSDISAFREFAAGLPGHVKKYAGISNSPNWLQTAIDLLNSGVHALWLNSEDEKTELIAAGVPQTRILGSNYHKINSLPTEPSKPADSPESLPIWLVPASALTPESVARVVTSRVTSDRPDGLFPTLVVDSGNRCLGLVYSSAVSVAEAFRTATGVYQSRRHGLWYKGATSGDTQRLLTVDLDCDADCLKFTVAQQGSGFCHLQQDTCFGDLQGLAKLEKILISRKTDAPKGSYTARLFADEKLLAAKIREEADELVEATEKADVAWEAADLLYFALVKAVKEGVSLADIEANIDSKHLKVTRRKGDAKPAYLKPEETEKTEKPKEGDEKSTNSASASASDAAFRLTTLSTATATPAEIAAALARPIQKTENIMKLVVPIVTDIKTKGDAALLEYTEKFDKVKLSTPFLAAPFPAELMQLTPEVQAAIDLSISNVEKFHAAQLSPDLQNVETTKGVFCSRYARAIDSVGLYIPGGTAVLPSTALMLGVPAKVAGVKNIYFASPPRPDGTLTPEVVYVAHKVGARGILLAGGAQAVAAMAYGTETVPKVDKIFGPGNQFVTAAKMHVQNDNSALVAIDMPAGPSEVLVICDKYADAGFVAADLLSQAEHGVDSQVVLLAVDMTEAEVEKVEAEVARQAKLLPRVEIVEKCLAHSCVVRVESYDEAIKLSNQYGPEHLILQIRDAAKFVPKVEHAGSVFVGPFSPESCGDYSSGTNHTLPTYGYAKMYSGVNTATFQKYITSQELTREGIEGIGRAVMALAAVEGLDAHRNAVKIRLESLGHTFDK